MIRLDLGRRTQSALSLLTQLFKWPIVQVKTVQEVCNLSKKTANELVGVFVEKGYLHEYTGQVRYRSFRFDPYLDLFID